MKKLKLLLAFCALLLGWSNAMAQFTDVTSTYITNASFESDGNSDASSANLTITGWTETQSSAGSYNDTQTRDKDTDNASAFGTKITPAEGTYYLFYRHGWNGDAGTTATLKSNLVSTLPAGIYRLEFKYQQSYNEDSSSKTTTRIKFAAKNKSTSAEIGSVTTANATKNATFANDGWSISSFVFYVDGTTDVDIEFTLYSGGQKRSDFLLDDVRLLKADYPATPIANNTADLYLKNEKTAQFLSAGQSWGTQAICDNYGQEVTATLSEGKYTLKTQQYNKYLGSNLYLDNGTAANWLFLETFSGSGKYYMTLDGTNYVTSNGEGNALITETSPTDASVWTIVSKADRKSALSSATIETPGDATFLIGDANFGRNCINTPWTIEASNKNLSGGNNTNNCAESFHSVFTLSQTLSSMPVGVYGLTAQGFYRQDGSDNENLPYFYIADQKGTFPLKTGSEDNMSDASVSFTAGNYTIDPIYYRLDAEGNLTLGAKLETNTNLWCIWDNFQLKYYGDVTVAAVKMKASVDAYNAAMAEATAFTEGSMFADAWTTLQSAITANTVNLNDPDLTEETLTTATANLVAANTAATAAVNTKTVYDNAVALVDGKTNVDLTSLVSNASFEDGNLNGWTSVDGGNVASNNNWSKVGTYYVERWTANGETTQSHLSDGTLTHDALVLPAGLYTITAKAQNQEQKNGVAGTGYFLYANDEKVEITGTNDYSISVLLSDKSELVIKFALEGCTGNWISCDDVHLTYVGEDFPAYTKATGKMDPTKSAAQDEAEETFNANKNVTNYNALIAAIANAEASVANYASLKAAIDKAEAVKTANNFVTADATTTFESAISTATNGWTDVTFTDAQATEQVTTLGSAVSGWHAIAIEGKAGAYIASAWGKTNENWWAAPYINTWSTEGDNDGSGFSVPFFEYYTGDKENLAANTFTATLTGLENGVYEVELWARVQRRSDADFNGDNSMITMNVNGGDAVSIMSDTEHTVGTGGSTMRLGRYTATGIVTDGTLTLSINVKLGANVHWLSWRDVTYTKVAPATVSKTITAAGWATYCSPYALDFSSSIANLEGAYIITGNTGSTLTLSDAIATTVPANTGLLLKGNGAVTIPVAASGSYDASDNKLVGVTSNTNIDAETGYVLMNETAGVGFYKNASAFTVGANTAYLPVENVSAARAAYFFGGEITGVANVEAAAEAKAQDGKFIENGKIVIVKNGVKYNAAGQQVK